MVRQLIKDRIKAIHPFPYVDKCLPIADWKDPTWNPEGFNPSISEHVKIQYKNLNKLQKLEEERIIINPTDQELLWAKQHSQWLYDKHEVDDSTEMQPTLLRIKSIKERLSQDGEIKSIERKMIKTSTLEKDTKGQSDAEEQHE